MYLSYEQIKTFEDSVGFKNLWAENEKIGKFLGFQPKITYSVGTKHASCYHPDERYFPTPGSQKAEAERWLADNHKRFPEGWVKKEGNYVKKNEYYPQFHQDWNHLMEAVKRLHEKGICVKIETDIFEMWRIVSRNCK